MASFWDAKSRAVAQTLIDHHRATCAILKQEAPITDDIVSECILTYERVRSTAGIGGIAQDMGRHLRKVAVWCDMHGYAPLHSLVVRDRKGDPGEGYRRCPGTTGDWSMDVRECIGFRGYPPAVR